MLDVYKTTITNQFEAVFCTMNACIERCPADAWDGPVVNLQFCQVVFHALFFSDYYLGESDEAFRRQPFHLAHPDIFRDYEELEDRPQQQTYDKATTQRYLTHCRSKALAVIAAETTQSLSAECGFERRDFSRAEMHVCNIRHIHHHAAQLSLRLRIDHSEEVPWVGSAWREF
jgi:hypothetical protein